jgi:hypothetical protein
MSYSEMSLIPDDIYVDLCIRSFVEISLGVRHIQIVM